ncbi:muscarinic acetylcholine receptor M5-like [Patiria miniata]|uniref:G-protein coupled receptors family 1 profile domain-containing protein n=1 Tax=Patiria miniata TaxID=46514 RepID=A0A914BJ94_PATMI|nr:muscarinic acetylcholine receptor M5-like [Patiria miniata]
MEETTTAVAFAPPWILGWPLPVQTVFGVVAGAVLLVVLLGNLTVLYTFARTRRLHTYANLYVVGQASADLLVGTLVTPLHAAYWSLGYWPFGHTLCLYLFLIVGASTFHTSYLITLIIAVDRYISIAYPIKHLSYRKTKVALTAIFLAFFIPVCLWLPFFFYWEFAYDGVFVVAPSFCVPVYISNAHVTVAVICVQTWAPILLTAIVYGRVYRIARFASASRKSGPARESATEASTSKATEVTTLDVGIAISKAAGRANLAFSLEDLGTDKGDDRGEEIDEPQRRASSRMGIPHSKSGRGDTLAEIKTVSSRNKLKGNKALRTLTPIFISMLLSGLPWAIISIVFVICPTCLPSIVNQSAVFLTRTFGAINPFCYAIANPLYRRAFLKIVCAKRNP